MISLLSDFPLFDDDPVDVAFPQDTLKKFQQALSHDYAKTKRTLWKHAIMLANGGTMPPHEEVDQRALEVVTKQGVTYLLWDHPPINPGDAVDMSCCIASIKKPL